MVNLMARNSLFCSYLIYYCSFITVVIWQKAMMAVVYPVAFVFIAALYSAFRNCCRKAADWFGSQTCQKHHLIFVVVVKKRSAF